VNGREARRSTIRVMHALLADLRLASRNVFRHWRRSSFALAAVASGVTALLLAAGFIEWNFFFYRESMIRSQLGHLQIHLAGYSEKGTSDPYAFVFELPKHESDAVSALKHVRSIAPRLSLQGLVSFGDATLPFVGEGIDPRHEAEPGQSVVVREGRDLGPDDRNAVTLGSGLASNLGVHPGERVVMMLNGPGGGINAIEAEVKGTFTTVSKAFDDAALRLPLADAQRLARVQGAQSFVVFLDDTARTQEAVDAVRAILPADRYEVVPWWERADFYNKSAALFGKQVGFMKVVIGLLIVLLISNTLTMSVLSRTGEIGTAMALGADRRSVLRRFVLEGAFVAIAGAVLGALLGLALAALISAIGIPVPPPPGMSHGYTGEILVTPSMIVDAIVLAVVTTLAASAYPAWKASRMVIVDALRHNRA
jgi:putative ABC transport system permease protein